MIGIIGAGISGLTLAYSLKKRNIPFFILETTDRIGGYLHSEKIGNYLLEYGANSLLCDSNILDFIQEIGLAGEVVHTNSVSKNRYIFKNGRYQILPSSPPKLIFSNFFSWKTKLAILKERNVKSKAKANETLSIFFERRFSKEIVDYTLNPFISGIYAGNPDELLVGKTFPVLAEYEQNYGSVLKGFIKNSGAERRKSINFQNGMQTLPDRLASLVQLGSIRKIERIEKIIKLPNNLFQIGDNQCDKLVITSPAFATAQLLQTLFPHFATALEKVHYPPMTVVYSAFKKSQVGHHLNGFGGLHPKIEKQFSAGSIWTSSVFPNRCPADEVLLTSFVGGSQYAENALLPKEILLEKLNQELCRNYQIEGKPIFQHLHHWAKAIPQYDLTINEVYRQAEGLEKENIFVCANWKDGVSVADCIRKALHLARIF
ncbi:MAG: protoporphyrinogen oxidase [Cytophagales bacterium]|nr:MAG: protoporphyrinogen oxidase [Cytophagales bacterium]